MKVTFVTSVAIVTPVPARSRKLMVGALGLPLDHAEGDEYYSTEKLGGRKHIGVRPLAQAAQACLGTTG